MAEASTSFDTQGFLNGLLKTAGDAYSAKQAAAVAKAAAKQQQWLAGTSTPVQDNVIDEGYVDGGGFDDQAKNVLIVAGLVVGGLVLFLALR